MNNLGLLGIGIQGAGYAVIESHTYGNENVTLVSLYVRSQVSVHAEHTHVERMLGGQCGQTQQRACCGQVTLLNELGQFLLGMTQLNAVAYQYERLAGAVDKTYRIVYLLLYRIGGGYVAAYIVYLGRLEVNLGYLCRLGEVKYNGTRTAGACYVECAGYSPGNILGTADLVAPLGDRLGNTYQVNLLEGIGTQGIGADLTGYDHDGCAVKHGVTYTCDGVGGAGTTGNYGHTCTARYAGVSLCGMGCTLLVTYQNLTQVSLMVIQGVIHLNY